MGPYPRTARGKRFILTVTDTLNRWVEAFPLGTSTIPTIRKTLQDEDFSRWGYPGQILTDIGPQFDSNEWSNKCNGKVTIGPPQFNNLRANLIISAPYRVGKAYSICGTTETLLPDKFPLRCFWEAPYRPPDFVYGTLETDNPTSRRDIKRNVNTKRSTSSSTRPTTHECRYSIPATLST